MVLHGIEVTVHHWRCACFDASVVDKKFLKVFDSSLDSACAAGSMESSAFY